MLATWERNIRENLALLRNNAGPAMVTVVSGSESDRTYWQQHFTDSRRDVFRRNGNVAILSVCEDIPKGNFLGTFNAWASAKAVYGHNELPDVALMSMVFGKGKRLSPFTQALGNRKPAFPTPMKAQISGRYLSTADVSNLYSNNWVSHLSESGFRGLVVKWGDEAIVPGTYWKPGQQDYHDVDAVRFVWETEITKNFAREKDWIVIDRQSGLMSFEFSRQDIRSLKTRLSEFDSRSSKFGVNLGSLAISYEFLEIAQEILGDDLKQSDKWVDWDPYGWLALLCKDEAQWRAEAEHEGRIGKSGIRDLEIRYPDFYPKVARLRSTLEYKTGRPLRVGVLDFGSAFWVDVGLHITLRQTLESMTEDSERGQASRELFAIPPERDKNGNIIVLSAISPTADIRDSVIIDSIILDQDSVVHGGVVIGGRHRQLYMPHGGSALFCAADRLLLTGQHGIAFRSIGSEITIPEGGRHTSLLLREQPVSVISNESIVDYSGEVYTKPILGNPLSFEAAGEIMSKLDGQDLEARWLDTWNNWLK